MIYQEKEQIPKHGSKVYYSFCVDNLGKQYQQWIVPCRILGISPADYVRLLVTEYNATILWYPKTQFLSRYWTSQSDASRWRLYINKVAKEKGFHI